MRLGVAVYILVGLFASACNVQVKSLSGGGTTTNNEPNPPPTQTPPTDNNGAAGLTTGAAMDKTQTTSLSYTKFAQAKDAVVVYVSSSTGKDGNTGADANHAVQSLAHGLSLAKSGKPFWMLLKRGDSWTTGTVPKMPAGRSADEKSVFSAYGSGRRPVLYVSGLNRIELCASHLAVAGIDFESTLRSPDLATFDFNAGKAATFDFGIRCGGPLDDLVFEDNYFKGFRNTFNFDNNTGDPMTHVTLYRNVITLSWGYSASANPEDARAQGMYAARVDGFSVKENICFIAGWAPVDANSFRSGFAHCSYFTEVKNADIVGNISAFSGGIDWKNVSYVNCGAKNLTLDQNYSISTIYPASAKFNKSQTLIPAGQEKTQLCNVKVTNNVFHRAGGDFRDVGGELKASHFSSEMRNIDKLVFRNNLYLDWADASGAMNVLSLSKLGSPDIGGNVAYQYVDPKSNTDLGLDETMNTIDPKAAALKNADASLSTYLDFSADDLNVAKTYFSRAKLDAVNKKPDEEIVLYYRLLNQRYGSFDKNLTGEALSAYFRNAHSLK